MSEYQYYEFAAIERPLTKEEMAELRTLSSRAAISPTGFVNEYHWGDLKGDPAQWVRRYFDAFVYTANWRSCRLLLRVPHAVLTKSDWKQFATDCTLTVADAKTHWIIDWSLDDSDNDDRFATADGRGWMGRLAPLRDELLRGDLRSLYIGWLAGVTCADVEDDALEPPIPAGMARLTVAQQALVEFLEVDPDLVTAAAAGQTDMQWCDDDSVEVWVAGLSQNLTRNVFTLLLQGEVQQAERRVRSEFAAWQKDSCSTIPTPVARRSVAELLTLAKLAEAQRSGRLAQERARQDEERRQEREAYLRSMLTASGQHWDALHVQAERGTASSYGEVTRVLGDLQQAYALIAQTNEFDSAFRQFVVRHAKRGALLRRLAEAGLWKPA